MSSLRHLNKAIYKRSLSMTQQTLAIRAFAVKNPKKISTARCVVAMVCAFVFGAISERMVDPHSSLGRYSRYGISMTLSQLVNSISMLSSFSAVFVYAELKRMILGER